MCGFSKQEFVSVWVGWLQVNKANEWDPPAHLGQLTELLTKLTLTHNRLRLFYPRVILLQLGLPLHGTRRRFDTNSVKTGKTNYQFLIIFLKKQPPCLPPRATTHTGPRATPSICQALNVTQSLTSSTSSTWARLSPAPR